MKIEESISSSFIKLKLNCNFSEAAALICPLIIIILHIKVILFFLTFFQFVTTIDKLLKSGSNSFRLRFQSFFLRGLLLWTHSPQTYTFSSDVSEFRQGSFMTRIVEVRSHKQSHACWCKCDFDKVSRVFRPNLDNFSREINVVNS